METDVAITANESEKGALKSLWEIYVFGVSCSLLQVTCHPWERNIRSETRNQDVGPSLSVSWPPNTAQFCLRSLGLLCHRHGMIVLTNGCENHRGS